jgi:hypothetical protein
VRVLFIAESPPIGGTFFYFANSNLFHTTQEAFAKAARSFRRATDFLSAFKAGGCYLEDLAVVPVNGLPRRERRDACKAGIAPLARRIRPLNPRVVVIVSYGINQWVADALDRAGHADVAREKLPFPVSRPRKVDGVPYRQVYVDELADLVRRWRRLGILAPL